jgi:hypothetical protein
VTLESFLPLLGGVKQHGGKVLALCPAHPDKSPSLSIREGTDGRILLHDFAGCEPQAIVAALGLRLSDLFPDSTASREEISRARRERDAKRAAEEAQRHKEGLTIDARREADALIRSRSGLDISGWTSERLDDELTALAAAHSVLWEESIDDRR